MTLTRGSRGDGVRDLQTQLARLGFYSGRVDGDFGPMTEAAVRAWRGDGLGTVDDAAFGRLCQAVAGVPQRASQAAIDLIKRFEGIEDGDPSTVNLDPYLCPAGYWTIGWGHVVLDRSGRMLHGPENKAAARAIFPGGITMAQAEDLLRQDLPERETAVRNLVRVPLHQNQFDALVDFVFNLGAANFGSSTLLRLLNAGNYAAAAAEFPKWNKSGGRALAGLTRRRDAERALFARA